MSKDKVTEEMLRAGAEILCHNHSALAGDEDAWRLHVDEARAIYLAMRAKEAPCPDDVERVKEAIRGAFADMRDGKPCGCIVTRGCGGAGYIDPESAAEGFLDEAARAAIASMPDDVERVAVDFIDAMLKDALIDSIPLPVPTGVAYIKVSELRAIIAALSSIQGGVDAQTTPEEDAHKCIA